jgi:hypothetical protein
MAFNNGPRITTSGLSLVVDAADRTSYPGSGNTWRDLITGTVTGSITGSVSYTSTYYGGLSFANTAAAILFPSTVASFGTSSFTVELTFTPSTISGSHWLFSKNSGSFPSFGAYLSGSNNSGKLVTEYRITSTVSCSYVSNTTLVTGSNYQIDINYMPFFTASLASGVFGAITYINSQVDNSIFTTNASGSLTNTASFILGNNSITSSGFIGTINSCRVYNRSAFAYFGLLPSQVLTNYQAQNYRMNLPRAIFTSFEVLVIAGGAAGGYAVWGGGGAGGVVYVPSINFSSYTGSIPIIVGAGGTGYGGPGSNSYILNRLDLLAYGGGSTGVNGGSGGGGYADAIGNLNSPGLGIANQGNPGGSGVPELPYGTYVRSVTGGGGGSGTAGVAGVSGSGLYKAGDGGSGSYFPQFAVLNYGSPAGYFGGGGGGVASNGNVPGVGGPGGGGAGAYTGVSAQPRTGGGGGASPPAGNNPGQGGSGIVIIRYQGVPIAAGGLITTTGSYTSHVFTSSGNFTFL